MSSVNNEQLNLSNYNELEEGEIFDSNINKQEIIKLIVFKKSLFNYFSFLIRMKIKRKIY